MTHQFKPGDRALILKCQNMKRPEFSYLLCTIQSHEFMDCGVLGHIIDIDEAPNSGGMWFGATKYLMPLPKNGPDAEVDMARKLVELNGGRDG